jgi:hypothetical protein
MSYVQKPRRVRTRSGRVVNLGNIFDDLSRLANSGQETNCINQANNSSTVKSVDAQIAQLLSTWKPTGYYKATEVQQLLDVIATEAQAAGVALKNAPRSTSDAEDQIAQAFDDLMRKWQSPAQNYQNAVYAAQKSGQAIDAPGLKDWVISSMRAISDAYVVVTVMECMQSWVEKWLSRAYSAMVAIGSVAYRVVGVAIAAGQAVVKAVETGVGILGLVAKYGPYAALGVGAWVLFKKAKAL